MIQVISHSTEETVRLGKRLSRFLRPGDILCLYGDLGSGKTTLIKGIASGLRVNPKCVKSPTFVLMDIYEGRLPLYHFDFYRIEDAHDIALIGYEEFLYGHGVSAVEWAERFGTLLPPGRLEIRLSHSAENSRLIQLDSTDARYKMILDKLSSAHKGSR